MYLSVVIPVYNEEENVTLLLDEVAAVLTTFEKESEILIIDDGSKDNTLNLLREYSKKCDILRVVSFRKNFGQTSAMSAGFDYAQGEIIVAMDGDRQNDPKDIPALLEKIESGFDIVSGWRKDRQDRFLSRRLPSMIANRIISMSTGVKLHDYGCSLKAFRKEVVKNINLYGELHRFIPAVASWMGTRLAEIEVNHRPRVAGTSKYGISRTVRVILDLILVKFLLSFSTKPIQIFGFWGILALLSGSALFLLVVFQRFLMEVPANRPLFTVAVMLLISGFQFICFGLLAEIQIRMYHESTSKPIYAVKEIIEKD